MHTLSFAGHHMIALESAQLPGQHVGILPSGYPKPPSQTGRGPHASYTVELIQKAEQNAGSLHLSFGGLHLHIVCALKGFDGLGYTVVASQLPPCTSC